MLVIIRLVIHIATDDPSVGKVSPGCIKGARLTLPICSFLEGSGRFRGYWSFCRKVGELFGRFEPGYGFGIGRLTFARVLQGLRQFRNMFGKFQKVWMVLGLRACKGSGGFREVLKWFWRIHAINRGYQKKICVGSIQIHQIYDANLDFEGFSHDFPMISSLFWCILWVGRKPWTSCCKVGSWLPTVKKSPGHLKA